MDQGRRDLRECRAASDLKATNRETNVRGSEYRTRAGIRGTELVRSIESIIYRNALHDVTDRTSALLTSGDGYRCRGRCIGRCDNHRLRCRRLQRGRNYKNENENEQNDGHARAATPQLRGMPNA